MATITIPGPILTTLKLGITALVPLSLVLFTQQRMLNPLYGSYLNLYSLKAVVPVAAFVSVLNPFGGNKEWNWLVGGLLLSIAPNASYWMAVWGGRQRWLTLGPILAHVIVAPLTLIFTEIVIQVCLLAIEVVAICDAKEEIRSLCPLMQSHLSRIGSLGQELLISQRKFWLRKCGLTFPI